MVKKGKPQYTRIIFPFFNFFLQKAYCKNLTLLTYSIFGEFSSKKVYQLKYLSCFVKLSPTSPFKLNQAQNSKYNTTKEFKLWQSIQTKQIVQFIVLLFLNYKSKMGHLKETSLKLLTVKTFPKWPSINK